MMQTIPLEYINHAIANLDYRFDCRHTHPTFTCN